jgi:predicted nucleic acid-binding Zn finger protein
MIAKEIQKRNVKANQLRVIQTENGQTFVESSQGKILYQVTLNNDEKSCTCGDFASNSKRDTAFKCKHIIAVENSVQDNDIESAKILDKNTPKLKERFLSNIKGKDFVLYAGVLDLATQRGLLRLDVELIQFPSKENGQEAICRAIAEGKNGEIFADVGDANPNNCPEVIAKHLIRLSSTRAKARVLRDMCNIGIACIEELDSMDDVIGAKTPPKTTRKPTLTLQKPAAPTNTNKPEETKEPAKVEAGSAPDVKKVPSVPSSKQEADPPDKSGVQKPVMSEAQRRAIFNLSRRRGISIEALNLAVQGDYGVTLEELSSADASVFIRNLQQAA